MAAVTNRRPGISLHLLFAIQRVTPIAMRRQRVHDIEKND